MKKSKITIILMICLAVCLVVTACGGNRADEVVATVNGAPITYASYVELYNGLMNQYGYEDSQELKELTIHELETQELLLQYAEENGLDAISEEEQMVIDESVINYFNTLKKQMVSEAGSQTGSTVYSNAAVNAQNSYEEYLKENYITEETVGEHYRRQIIFEKARDSIMEGFEVTDGEIQDYYDENLGIQQTAAEEDPDAAADAYLNGEYDISLYAPDSLIGKARMIRHILIEIPEDQYAQILELQQEGDTEAAEQIRQEALEEIYPRAQEVITKLREGEDFDALIAEYNEDPGMDSYPEGYLVYEGSSFVQSFIDEAMGFENIGDTSDEPVESFYGYHIMQYAADPQTGAVPLEEAEDNIRTLLASQNQSAYWQEQLEKLMEQADIVEYDFS